MAIDPRVPLARIVAGTKLELLEKPNQPSPAKPLSQGGKTLAADFIERLVHRVAP